MGGSRQDTDSFFNTPISNLVEPMIDRWYLKFTSICTNIIKDLGKDKKIGKVKVKLQRYFLWSMQ